MLTSEHNEPDFEPSAENSVDGAPITSLDVETVLVRFFNSPTGESTYVVRDREAPGGATMMQLDGRDGTFVVRRLLGTDDNRTSEVFRGDNLFEAAYALLDGENIVDTDDE
ncbi:MAG: hypothetical protein ABEN55_00425 [Bradymonadaceae bacterium]